MMMTTVKLNDPSAFELIGGLWKGERAPLMQARVLRSTNFNGDGILDFGDVVELEVEARHAATKQLKDGDIVVERSGGGPKQPVGRVSLFNAPDQQAYFSSNFTTTLRIRNHEILDPKYTSLYLHALYLNGDTETLQRATTGIRNLDWSEYLNFEIPLLPIYEQKALGHLIDQVRKAYNNEWKLLQALTELKQATMQQLFTRGLRGESQKETEIGLMPDSWSIAQLADVSKLERGRFMHRPRNEPRFYGGATPFVQTGDVVRSYGYIRQYTQTLNHAGVEISRVFPKDTILITIAANIGYSGVLEFDSACPDSLIGITPNTGINNRFLNYYLQTQRTRMDEAAPKGTQKNINIQFLAPWPIVVPPYREQIEIADLLFAIDQKIALHKEKQTVLEELFRALLHKLMTGGLSVNNLDLTALQDFVTSNPAPAAIEGSTP